MPDTKSPGRCITSVKGSTCKRRTPKNSSTKVKVLKKNDTKAIIKKIALGATAVAALGATGLAIHNTLKKIKENKMSLEGEAAKKHVLNAINSTVSKEQASNFKQIEDARKRINNEVPDIQMEEIHQNLKKEYINTLEQEEKLKKQALKEILREFSKMKLAHLDKANVENVCDFYKRSLEFIDKTCQYSASKPACIKKRFGDYGINEDKLHKNLKLFSC